MNDFDYVGEKFYIECIDYLTNRKYVSKEAFETFEDARKAIPALVPPSACCGFSIVSMPVLDFGV